MNLFIKNEYTGILENVEKILFTITAKAIVMRFKYDSKEKAREEYLKQIEYLKYGILKQ